MSLRTIRAELGLSQIELSKRAKISQGKVCEYEKGKVIPRVDTALKIANALGKTVEEIWGPKARDCNG